MAAGFQVLTFAVLEFDEHWKRSLPPSPFALVQYTAAAPLAKLGVACEAPTGTVTTYRFDLKLGDEVLVIDQVVHVPARCVRQEQGDTIRCPQQG